AVKTKLLIFGLTGDLGRKKLLPAIDRIVQSDEFVTLEVIGVSRRHIDKHQLISEAGASDALAARTTIFTMDLSEPDDYARLRDYLDIKDDEQLIAYLSVPPL